MCVYIPHGKKWARMDPRNHVLGLQIDKGRGNFKAERGGPM